MFFAQSYGAITANPTKSTFSSGRKRICMWSLLLIFLAPCLAFGFLFWCVSFLVSNLGQEALECLYALACLACLFFMKKTYDLYVKWQTLESGEPVCSEETDPLTSNEEESIYNEASSGPRFGLGKARGYVDYIRPTEEAKDRMFEAFVLALVLLVSVIGALVLSGCLGVLNFDLFGKELSRLDKLNTYFDVNTCTTPGQQLLDAGRVGFAQGSALDLAKAGSFRERTVYCVAPITCKAPPASFGKGAGGGSYDFWAVGTDCCDGTGFHCRNANNPDAMAGVRLLEAGEKSYYRLAVQQVEAAHDIRATHPLFFHWVEKFEDEANPAKAWHFYAMGIGGYMMWQLLIVLIAAFWLKKRWSERQSAPAWRGSAWRAVI